MGCCAPPPLTLRPQMCNLLQYFCDRELQHRVEAIVAFSERHVERLQRDQRRRYGQLMRALTMSAAETARRTREFRSPPQEQVTPPGPGTRTGNGDGDGDTHGDMDGKWGRGWGRARGRAQGHGGSRGCAPGDLRTL